jgi:hypothetical protein
MNAWNQPGFSPKIATPPLTQLPFITKGLQEKWGQKAAKNCNIPAKNRNSHAGIRKIGASERIFSDLRSLFAASLIHSFTAASLY